jgi:hypothetical protein
LLSTWQVLSAPRFIAPAWAAVTAIPTESPTAGEQSRRAGASRASPLAGDPTVAGSPAAVKPGVPPFGPCRSGTTVAAA